MSVKVALVVSNSRRLQLPYNYLGDPIDALILL